MGPIRKLATFKKGEKKKRKGTIIIVGYLKITVTSFLERQWRRIWLPAAAGTPRGDIFHDKETNKADYFFTRTFLG